MTDGSIQVGFIEAENDGEISLRIVTGQIVKITAAKVKQRTISQQSMMAAPSWMGKLIGEYNSTFVT